MKQNKLVEYIKLCIKKQLDFVVFCPYGSSSPSLLISKGVTKYPIEQIGQLFNKQGFIIAPFDAKNGVYWFEPFHFYKNIEDVDPQIINNIPSCAGKMISIDNSFTEHTFEDYEKEFNLFKNKIEEGAIKKVILSRLKIVNDIESQRSAKYFDVISKMYPESFAYLAYSAETGLWMGMSPELFLSIEDNLITTVSLAGTKSAAHIDSDWNAKDTTEQDIVSNYIEDLFKQFNIKELQKSGPSTVIAGSVAHLKTIFKFPKSHLNNIGEFIEKLHPTPAVCGEPKEKAMQLIKETERHNRELYAGFLGPVGLLGNTTLYVNIRCMKFYNNKAALFIGGGITSGSSLEQEWEETELKSQSLLSVVLNS